MVPTKYYQRELPAQIHQKFFKLNQAILFLLAEYKKTKNNINDLLDKISVPGLTPKEVE